MTKDLEQLTALGDELQRRGWRARLSGDRLKAVNPVAKQLSEDIVSDGQNYLWVWGKQIVPVADVVAAADRVTHVLRAVEP